MTDPVRPTTTASSRRDFLRTSTVAALGATGLAAVPTVHAAGSDTLKVGVIGCGGRGTGAAENICQAAGTTYGVKLYALADVFEDRLQNSLGRLKRSEVCEGKLDVSPDRCFVGFDAFQKVTDCCDLVILATPPGFRPQHLEYAVKAGKHIFTEKPVAVDATGIRKVLAAAEEAKSKGLAVVAGTQRRHQAGYIESMKQIHGGALGDLVTARVFWNQGNIWAHERQPGWNDMEYQLRNWYHFTWLCGDHIVEQHVHNLDVACWALGGHPVSCVGMGGQQVNTAPKYGESYDHFAVDYEFPNGVHVLSMCRQIAGCANDVSEYIVGTKGRAHLAPGRYNFEGNGLGRLRVRGEVNPYVQEHIDLLASIRDGKPLNELKQVAESTLTAIMGRMSAYTGKAVSWEQALNSKLDTFPAKLEWGSRPEPVVAKPGVTELI
ncbi:MAG: Gfo/Idh/MocA family oxidoreductase [Isosphaeraceae bacterium]|nr:Gfo/Idh/MocA family oxidoreductase [Isosphaeraceae bacterium]